MVTEQTIARRDHGADKVVTRNEMPRDGSEGFSEQTPRKQEDLRYVFRTGMMVQMAIWKKYPRMPQTLFYLDLRAGSGIVGGAEGSPAIFWREALALGVPCQAYFCERDPQSADRLRACLKAMGPSVW